QQLHARIAHILENQFPEIASATPEFVAQYYSEGGVPAQAIPHWLRAGQNALRRSAIAEAMSHLSKGLELVPTLQNELERKEHELGLQATLGLALAASRGYGVPEVEQAYRRARVLCDEIGNAPQLFPV
ncbi:MAG TPA: hypothetical protein VEH47_00985, partial [Candidatus Acidoferrales bacterium]|nr:hypothetical protein [Candidatus Acidoferrales bacterium]